MEYSLVQLKINLDVEIIDELFWLCCKEDCMCFEKVLVEFEDGIIIENELFNIKFVYFVG